MSRQNPKAPNILVTGTPCTGKSCLAEMIEQESGGKFQHIEVGRVVKEKKFYTAYDEHFDTLVIEEDDEDRLLDFLEPMMVEGGKILDYHSCELFPERWFSNGGAVIVLKASTNVHHDRMKKRSYKDCKVEENQEAEIMDIVAEEALNSYKAEIVHVRENDNVDQMNKTSDLALDILEGKAAKK